AIDFAGLTNAWTMPIKTRIDMLSTGIKTPVGVKLMGPDLNVLSDLGQRIAAVLQTVPGTLSAFADKTVGGNFLDYRIKREEAARYGLTVGDVQDVIMTGIGGMNVTQTIEGLARYPVNVRYSRELRDNLGALQRVLIPTPSGAQIPLSYVTDLEIVKGPPVVKSENARKTSWIYVDIRDIDVGTYVKNARATVDAEVDLPEGYSIVWSGQYEYMQRAQERLRIVLPVTLLIIFLLLYFNFKNIQESLIVMLSLPFSLVGGIWFLYVLDYDLSVAVGVGFIALAGVSAEIGVIMLTYLDQAFKDKIMQGQMGSLADLKDAIFKGTALRIRPIFMTVTAIIAGLLPIMWGHGTGSEVMKRIAAPMVGGMISTTMLSLLVIPTIYFLWRSYQMKQMDRALESETETEMISTGVAGVD
ncbi:MAG: efflux RND transporter permease subunit, partial [Bacteroidetes bacterium]|nr:efflux RND transporter permease subunit [Bacteroidota bacterium]